MAKFRILLTVHCLLALWGLPVIVWAASFVSAPEVVRQGDFFQLLIPKQEFSYVAGNVDGQMIDFFELTRPPSFDEPISRGEFLELVFKNTDLLNDNVTALPQFTDIKDSPYEEVIRQAAVLGIVHGYPDGSFRPYESISRGQAAKILMNALNPEIQEHHLSFADLPTDHVFYPFLQRAIAAGIFQGYPDKLIRPDRFINFSESETILKRALDQAELRGMQPRSYYQAFIGVPRQELAGEKQIKLNVRLKGGKILDLSKQVAVQGRRFAVKSFDLAYDKSQLFAKQLQDATWKMVNDAKKKSSPVSFRQGAFIQPVQGIKTLGFGDLLYINGKYSGSHFGIDWANRQGTEVLAANAGQVVLSDFTPSFGNTIVIDHGHNIFTMYLHLFELKAQVGDIVEKAQMIGLMGTTGISTGPHLHFTHFIDDVIVDSDPWFQQEWQ